ncbi:MAG TPA: hypothetical protein VE713_10535 [Pyrinomonadaceae bacterium]|jgi:hypothetical protein|nr:hypothetical protein [Pyrinomonadaceae bacterium]
MKTASAAGESFKGEHMSIDPASLSWRLRRLIRRAVCERFGHTWSFSAGSFYCRACRISGYDAYSRRGRVR